MISSGLYQCEATYKRKRPQFAGAFFYKWLRQESNLNLELRKLLYYPLYYEAGSANIAHFCVSRYTF